MARLREAWEEVLAEELQKPVVKEMYESLQAHQAKVDAWNNLQSLE